MHANYDIVERDLNRHLSDIDREEWFSELNRLGFPHPCLDCRERCTPHCEFWGVRGFNTGE